MHRTKRSVGLDLVCLGALTLLFVAAAALMLLLRAAPPGGFLHGTRLRRAKAAVFRKVLSEVELLDVTGVDDDGPPRGQAVVEEARIAVLPDASSRM